jgi:hypothetical protein
MSRIRINGVGDPAGSVNPLTISTAAATTASWTSSPSNMPSLPFAWPDYMVVVAEPGTANSEVFWIVGWVPGSTSATILRTPPGETNPGTPRAHSSTGWLHGPTQIDYKSPASRLFASTNFT